MQNINECTVKRVEKLIFDSETKIGNEPKKIVAKMDRWAELDKVESKKADEDDDDDEDEEDDNEDDDEAFEENW